MKEELNEETSTTSQNSSRATPCNNLRTRWGLSAPGISIWMRPVPGNRWILGADVPNWSKRFFKIVYERSMALSISKFTTSIICASSSLMLIRPRVEAFAKTDDNFLSGFWSLNALKNKSLKFSWLLRNPTRAVLRAFTKEESLVFPANPLMMSTGETSSVTCIPPCKSRPMFNSLSFTSL